MEQKFSLMFSFVGGGGALSRLVHLFRELLLNQSVLYLISNIFFLVCSVLCN